MEKKKREKWRRRRQKKGGKSRRESGNMYCSLLNARVLLVKLIRSVRSPFVGLLTQLVQT